MTKKDYTDENNKIGQKNKSTNLQLTQIKWKKILKHSAINQMSYKMNWCIVPSPFSCQSINSQLMNDNK
jgi:hypothetical protein